jgi:chemotaxis protein methyltransferase CheR
MKARLLVEGGRDYRAALDLAEQAIRADHRMARAHALKGGLLLNLGRMDEARQACEAALAIEPMDFEAHYLLGMIARALSDYDSAKKRFRDCAYIIPGAWQAHFQLAETHFQNREHPHATREYGTAIRCACESFADDHGSVFLRVPLSQSQVIDLCRHRITFLTAL